MVADEGRFLGLCWSNSDIITAIGAASRDLRCAFGSVDDEERLVIQKENAAILEKKVEGSASAYQSASRTVNGDSGLRLGRRSTSPSTFGMVHR